MESVKGGRRGAQARATRRRITDASAALVIEQGYGRTTLEQIAGWPSSRCRPKDGPEREVAGMSHGGPAGLRLPDGEPWAGPWRSVAVTDLVADLLRTPPTADRRPAVVAVDGRSASGKSTLAAGLVAAVPHAHLVHTDDIAWWHSFFDWAGLMRSGVLEPVHRGAAVEFTPPAWTERGRPGAVVVPADAALVVVEGVGAGRHELADLVDLTIWVQADEEVRMAREATRIARGEVTAELVDEWQREEYPFVARQRVWERADHVVAGCMGALTGGRQPRRAAHDVLVGRR